MNPLNLKGSPAVRMGLKTANHGLPGTQHIYILSRASEVGSSTNPPWAPGSKVRDPLVRSQVDYFSHNYLQKFKKETDRTFDPLFNKAG